MGKEIRKRPHLPLNGNAGRAKPPRPPPRLRHRCRHPRAPSKRMSDLLEPFLRSSLKIKHGGHTNEAWSAWLRRGCALVVVAVFTARRCLRCGDRRSTCASSVSGLCRIRLRDNASVRERHRKRATKQPHDVKGERGRGQGVLMFPSYLCPASSLQAQRQRTQAAGTKGRTTKTTRKTEQTGVGMKNEKLIRWRQ